jgi:hypothetical protein
VPNLLNKKAFILGPSLAKAIFVGANIVPDTGKPRSETWTSPVFKSPKWNVLQAAGGMSRVSKEGSGGTRSASVA